MEHPASPASGDLLVEHLSKSYPTPAGPVPVLRDVSLRLQPGASLAVVGPSGSGKSTLLNILGALDRPDAGRVCLGGTDVARLDDRAAAAYRHRQVGFVFQDHHLLPQCTALENVLLPTLAGPPAADADEQAAALLQRVGLAAKLHAFPDHLSGGERQRVAVARALVNRPALLLCDEPTGNLDPDSAARVVDLFLELAADHGVILVMVTHNTGLAGRLSATASLTDGTLRPGPGPAVAAAGGAGP